MTLTNFFEICQNCKAILKERRQSEALSNYNKKQRRDVKGIILTCTDGELCTEKGMYGLSSREVFLASVNPSLDIEHFSDAPFPVVLTFQFSPASNYTSCLTVLPACSIPGMTESIYIATLGVDPPAGSSTSVSASFSSVV